MPALPPLHIRRVAACDVTPTDYVRDTAGWWQKVTAVDDNRDGSVTIWTEADVLRLPTFDPVDATDGTGITDRVFAAIPEPDAAAAAATSRTGHVDVMDAAQVSASTADRIIRQLIRQGKVAGAGAHIRRRTAAELERWRDLRSDVDELTPAMPNASFRMTDEQKVEVSLTLTATEAGRLVDGKLTLDDVARTRRP